MSQPGKTDATTSLQDLKDYMVAFREERGWTKHHSSKNLAMSIAIEAAELMELYQWDDYSQRSKQQAADELADILSYILSFADTNDIDIASAFFAKMERVKQKYPTSLFNPENDNMSAHYEIKQRYRQNRRDGKDESA